MTPKLSLAVYIIAFKKASDYLLENSSPEQKEEFYIRLKYYLQTIDFPSDHHLMDELDEVNNILSSY